MSNMAMIGVAYTIVGGAIAVGIGIAGLPAAFLARQTIWSGKEVLKMAQAPENSECKKKLLQIAAIAIVVLGTLIGVAASLASTAGVGLGVAFLGSTLINPGVGSVLGIISGLFMGAVAMKIALSPLFHLSPLFQPVNPLAAHS